VTLYNHHLTNTVAIFKNSHWLVNIGPGGTFTNSEFSPTDYVRVFNQSTSTYLRDATLNDTWHITGRVVFNYYGGPYDYGDDHPLIPFPMGWLFSLKIGNRRSRKLLNTPARRP